ncbi:MAG: Do family serine endopeptidase [Bacteroidota bacterium]|nr:Do family serine endopeptidase [Bacteroidota bacterium]
MSRRSILSAIVLIITGMVIGTLLVTGFGGLNHSFADSGVVLSTAPPFNPPDEVTALNQTFTAVSDLVTPTVVAITVKSKVEGGFHRFWPFGDIFPQPPTEEQLQQGSGSGIILTKDGYILTNRHVVEGATEDGIKVLLYDSREFKAKLVGDDRNTDIAVIKIDADGLTPASIGNSDDVRVGEWVLAVGNPLGLTSTVTAGIVSAISRNIGILRSKNADGTGIENFIQTDAAINPGNSGGALVNLRGQVIGVNTAIASNTGLYMGYGFAVPINLAKVVANAIIKEGKFVRGYIGIRITDLDAKKAKALGMDRYKGVLVDEVQPEGAGKEAGVKVGDAIVEVDGKPVMSANELQARVGMHHPGEVVRLKIFRDGKYFEIDVKLKGRSESGESVDVDESVDSGSEDMADSRSTLTFEKAGFSVRALDDQARKAFNRTTGVLVTHVKQYSPAWENNLRQGVVIFEARKGGTTTKIDKPSDLKKVLAGLKEGESVLLRVQTPNGDTTFIPIEGPAM